jgi:hypothetical protein
MGFGGIQNQSESQNPKSAAWRSRQSRRLDLDTGGDDRWKDRIILFGVIFVGSQFTSRASASLMECSQTIAAFVAQTMTTRREALAEMHRQGLRIPQIAPTRNSQKIEDWALAASRPDEMPKKS